MVLQSAPTILRQGGSDMARMTGVKAHAARLKFIAGPENARQVGAALMDGGKLIAVDAQISITAGSASGTETKKHQHVPSQPGEAPNNFSGHLADNIETVQEEQLRVVVSSNAEYSRALEFGTSKMAARPFMAPATARKRKEVVELVRQAVKKVAKGGKVVP